MSDTSPAETSTSAPVGPPVVVEADGWTVTSGSVGTPQTAETLRQTLTAQEATQTSTDTGTEAPVSPVTTTQATETPAEPAAEGETADPQKARKKTPWSQRIQEMQAQVNSLAAAKGRERTERDALQAEIATLTAERDKLKASPVTTTQAPAASPVDTTKPTWAAYEADGKTWDEYADAWHTWQQGQLTKLTETARADAVKTARAELETQLQHERASQEQDAVSRAHRERVAKIAATDPEFLGRVQANLSDVPQTPFMRDVVLRHPDGASILNHLSQNPETAQALSVLTPEATHPMMDAVMAMKDPSGLLDHWAAHPDDFTALAQMPMRSALLALGSLVARFDRPDGAKTSGSPAVAAPVTSATPPIRPVGGSRSTGDRRALEDLPFDQYVKEANKLEVAQRRRP